MTEKNTTMKPLTAQETEALRCAANGMCNKATGKSMGLSPETVKDHRSSSFPKLGAKNITQAVAIALTRGLIKLGGAK